jgi:hypothetical protein
VLFRSGVMRAHGGSFKPIPPIRRGALHAPSLDVNNGKGIGKEKSARSAPLRGGVRWIPRGRPCPLERGRPALDSFSPRAEERGNEVMRAYGGSFKPIPPIRRGALHAPSLDVNDGKGIGKEMGARSAPLPRIPRGGKPFRRALTRRRPRMGWQPPCSPPLVRGGEQGRRIVSASCDSSDGQMRLPCIRVIMYS